PAVEVLPSILAARPASISVMADAALGGSCVPNADGASERADAAPTGSCTPSSPVATGDATPSGEVPLRCTEALPAANGLPDRSPTLGEGERAFQQMRL
ncbi:MAG: hypothetical protein AAGA56_30385, partial [Myxococcota bacterium]